MREQRQGVQRHVVERILMQRYSFIYLLNLAYAIYNMIPTAEEKEEMQERKMMKGTGDDASSENVTPSDKVVFEMIPPSRAHVQQQMPFTPRTQAFNTLERKLPLRGD